MLEGGLVNQLQKQPMCDLEHLHWGQELGLESFSLAVPSLVEQSGQLQDLSSDQEHHHQDTQVLSVAAGLRLQSSAEHSLQML